MVLYTFTKKINCPKTNSVNDASKCTVNIKEKIKEKFNLIKEKDRYNFASHIIHEQNNHLISIFLCSKNGKEETPKISVVAGKLMVTPEELDQSHAVKCKNIPTKNQVMDLI